jgi:hypothetical protein
MHQLCLRRLRLRGTNRADVSDALQKNIEQISELRFAKPQAARVKLQSF